VGCLNALAFQTSQRCRGLIATSRACRRPAVKSWLHLPLPLSLAADEVTRSPSCRTERNAIGRHCRNWDLEKRLLAKSWARSQDDDVASYDSLHPLPSKRLQSATTLRPPCRFPSHHSQLTVLRPAAHQQGSAHRSGILPSTLAKMWTWIPMTLDATWDAKVSLQSPLPSALVPVNHVVPISPSLQRIP
jgi:hypothetical protein